MTTCLVPECDNPVYCKQVCHLHYKRLRRTGDFKRSIREDGAGTLRGGYVHVMINGKRKDKHIFIAEKALGRKLPIGAEVHHVDLDRANNDPSNLVICPNKLYHRLLHKRQKALEECGNPSWEKCCICKTYDAPENLKGLKEKVKRYHKGAMRETCNTNRCQNA